MKRPFPIDLAQTTELLTRFHRRLMDRQTPDWDSFRADLYDAETGARSGWSRRDGGFAPAGP